MRLLFVTPYFPPASGSGVPRGTKFVKYLLRMGWQVRVVTIDPGAWPHSDPGLLAEVEGAAVAHVGLSNIPGVRHTVLRALPGIRGAVSRSLHEDRPDVVMMTGPDWHWAVTAREARHAGVPYVVDYPDPWSVLPDDFRLGRRPEKLRSRLKWALAPRVEGRVLEHAAAAVFATEPVLEEYRRRWPTLGERGVVVGNGFDEEDFTDVEAVPHSERFRVVHVGSFGGPRTPLSAARAVREAADRIGPQRLELALVGAGAEPFLDETRRILSGVELEVTGWVPHSRAIAEMCSADALWLDAITHLRYPVPGKLYEYLRSGRPIVAVAHASGATSDLIREATGREVHTDADSAGAEIAELARTGIAGSVVADPAVLEPWRRDRLTERLAEILEDAARGAVR